MINLLKITALSIAIFTTGCASMLGINKPGADTVMTQNEDGSVTATGVITEITEREYRATSTGENTGRGLAQGMAGLLGPLSSAVAAGADMAYEPQIENKVFQILTVSVNGEEVQVIQMPPNEEYPGLIFDQDFKIGQEVLLSGDQNTPIHAEHL